MVCSAASPYSRPEEDPVLGSGQAMRRSWIEVPYAEEDLTRLEEEVIPVLRSYLERIDEIDRQLEEAQEAGAD